VKIDSLVFIIERMEIKMKQLVATILTLSVLALASADASQPSATSGGSAPQAASNAESQMISITRIGSQPSAKGSAEYFTGVVRIDSRFQRSNPARVGGGIVTFEPGARTAWHTHALGQTLIVTAGAGLVQQWGGPIQEMKPGDIVWIPPGVKHWHGATATTGMAHIAIAEALEGKAAQWMEKVTDEQYNGK
jgi:quercetin dioxygenase-like cupin family protein